MFVLRVLDGCYYQKLASPSIASRHPQFSFFVSVSDVATQLKLLSFMLHPRFVLSPVRPEDAAPLKLVCSQILRVIRSE